MAINNKGLHSFTVQEANNFEAFDEWNFQNVDVSGDSVDDGVDSLYITSANPAKKVVIFDSSGVMDAADSITITINGNSDTGKPITISGANLPFTISGIILTDLSFTMPDGSTDTSETLGLLSFH
tara:strand:+ start:298 stop:672 length:375 start_codon:yes stop_codon:yes gene_type:complete